MHAGPLTFARRDDGRIVAGVARGFAEQHGLDVIVVRGALVLLTFAGGLGIVLYALGAAVADPPAATSSTPTSTSTSTSVPPPTERTHFRNASVAALTFGLLLVVRSTGLWLGDALMASLVVIVAGLVTLGVARPDVLARSRDAAVSGGLGDLAAGRWAAGRVIAGGVLVSLGLVLVGVSGGVSRSVRVGAFATALTILGVAVVLGPWMARMVQEMASERRQRIRVQEREAMAAHLHDSVLQTLALIQRTADDPRRTVTLARRQERELREWLYGSPDVASAAPTLAAAVRAVAAEIESGYDVAIDVVVVGDRAMDDRLVALVAAVREACVNAAKHSGEASMSLYVEVAAGSVEAFVRDRGRGFDRVDAGPDRRGIAQSIEARMARVGGEAEVESAPGGGTEVRLRLPLEVGAP